MEALIHSAAEIVRKALLDADLVGPLEEAPVEWPSVVSFIPESPDNLVVFTDTASQPLGRDVGSGRAYEFHGVQILLRASYKEHNEGLLKLRSLVTLLDELKLLTVEFDDSGKFVIHQVNAERPQFAGREPENRRPLFISNTFVYLSSPERN